MPDPRRSSPWPACAAAACAALVLAPAVAHAYIDPGTGSFVIQGIIAAVVGAGVALKMFWGRITGALGGKRRRTDDDDDA